MTMLAERQQVIRERAYAIWEEEDRPDGKDVDHWVQAEAEIDSTPTTAEARVPQAWYAIVTASQASLRSYFDHYRAMKDPALEPMPSEGPEFAKLSSTLLAGADHTEVEREAIRLVEIITGVAKIKQDPGNLYLQSVVAIYAGGEIKRFPRTGLRITLSRPYIILKEEGKVKETFEKSVVLFALTSNTLHPEVTEVLRSFAQSDDWAGLFRILEIISHYLNEKDPKRKKKRTTQLIWQRGYLTGLKQRFGESRVDLMAYGRTPWS
jgi:hypothetical protein